MASFVWFAVPTVVEIGVIFLALKASARFPRATAVTALILAGVIAYFFGPAVAAGGLPAETQRGYVRSRYDASTSLVDDFPIPHMPRHTALVRVHASSLNPVDYKLIWTSIPVVRWIRPRTFGMDFAGEIVGKHPSGCEKFSVGDRVFGTSLTGSLAEYALASCAMLGTLPAEMSYTEGAALPVAAIAGWGSLAMIGELDKADDLSQKSILVVGASGGCGSMGVKLAHALGFGRVATVQSRKSVDFVKKRISSNVTPYAYDDPASMAELSKQRFDYIYDTVTSPSDVDYYPVVAPLLLPQSPPVRYQYLAINGTPTDILRTVLNVILPFFRFERPSYHFFHGILKTADWDAYAVYASATVPPISQTFKFTAEDVDKAFTLLKSRRAKGKLVVEMV